MLNINPTANGRPGSAALAGPRRRIDRQRCAGRVLTIAGNGRSARDHCGPSTVWIVGDVYEKDIAKVQPGSRSASRSMPILAAMDRAH